MNTTPSAEAVERERIAQKALKDIQQVHKRVRCKPKPGSDHLISEEAANLMAAIASEALLRMKEIR